VAVVLASVPAVVVVAVVVVVAAAVAAAVSVPELSDTQARRKLARQ